MPIKRNLNESLIKERGASRMLYLQSLGEKVGKYKVGQWSFIPLMALATDKVPAYWTKYEKEHKDNKYPIMYFTDFDSESSVNTRHDRFTWTAGFGTDDGKVNFVNAKWVDSGLDVSAGDNVNDPGRDLGLMLKKKKNTLMFKTTMKSTFAPGHTYEKYVYLPVIWDLNQNDMDYWTAGEVQSGKVTLPAAQVYLLELPYRNYLELKELVEKNERKRSTWAWGEEEAEAHTFTGSSGFPVVMRLDKNTERGFGTYKWEVAGEPNQYEVMDNLAEAYDMMVEAKENIAKFQAPWQQYADMMFAGELSETEANDKVVATIAMMVLTHFGYDLDPDTQTKEILEIWEKELPRLSYSPGVDAGNAILESADGNLSSDDDESFEEGDDF